MPVSLKSPGHLTCPLKFPGKSLQNMLSVATATSPQISPFDDEKRHQCFGVYRHISVYSCLALECVLCGGAESIMSHPVASVCE